MKNYINKIFTTLILLTYLSGCTFGSQSSFSYPYKDDVKFWENVFNQRSHTEFSNVPTAAILPSDIIVVDELSKFYIGLSHKTTPDTFILVASYVESNQQNDIKTCIECTFSTINGDIHTNSELGEKLITGMIAHKDNGIFNQEETISIHASLIKKNFPNANIVHMYKKKTIAFNSYIK